MKKILTIIIVIVALQLGVVSMASADGGSGGGGGGGSYHRVSYGDTLFSIGRQYGVSAYRIADANGLSNPNRIYAGQVLYIPSGGYGNCYNQGCGNNGGQGFHIVRYGETLYSIGRLYNVHPNHIADVNNLQNPNFIYVGQRLRIPSGSSYPWGGCGGYGYGCNNSQYGNGYYSGCGGYGSGCNGYNSGCGGYGSGCDGYYSGCGGYGYGCDNVDPGYGVPAPGSGCGGYGSGCNWNNSGCGGYGSGCSNYGYDYTGYYYNRGNQRYSFTCGYNFNCW